MELLSQYLSQSFTQGLSLSSVFLGILVCYLGGVLSSLTPCVYPMIPITLSMVGGIQESKRSWKTLLLRSLFYILGMALIYAFLGVFAGLSGKIFGTFTQTATWNIFLGIVLSFSALWMLEVIEMDPSRWFYSWSARGKKMESPGEVQTNNLVAFSLGATSGFVAAPCTTPVLMAILGFIAQTQSILLGFLFMIAFAFGLGTLLLVLALFAGSFQVLPRSGKWLKLLKILSGFILLGLAHYLFYQAGLLGGS